MRTAIAIFVKTPGLTPLKTRLVAEIGADRALAFYELSLKAITETAQTSNAVPYWAVGEVKAFDHPLWRAFPSMHTGNGDLGDRQCHVYETLLKMHDVVILIGADAPQLSADMIDETIAHLNTHDTVIGPARDGGYYLLGGRTSIPKSTWNAVPWSTDKTLSILQSHLPTAPYYLPVLTDVDTADDLDHVVNEMPNIMTPSQTDVVDWIEKIGV